MQIQLLMALVRTAAPTDRAVRATVDGVVYRITGHEAIFARPLKAWIWRDPGSGHERLRLDIAEGEAPARLLWDLRTATMTVLDPRAESYSEHPMSSAEFVVSHGPIVARGTTEGWGPWTETAWSRWTEPGPTTSLFRLERDGWGLVQQFWSDEGAMQGVQLAEPVPFDDAAALEIPAQYRRLPER